MSVTTALIEVKQLPIIEEQLRSLQSEIANIVQEATAMACTEETLVAVKERRAELNKLFGELEARRKAVKAEVMAPYERFETIYKDCVSVPFKAADAELKQKITDTENDIKARCEEGLKRYFEELCAAYQIDWLRWPQAGIKVDMASARQQGMPKKLMDNIRIFVFGVANNIKWIASLDHGDEILVEYKKSLNATEAAAVVSERHKSIAREQQRREENEARTETPPAARNEDTAFAPPKHVQAAEVERLTVAFEVTDTMERLKTLKQWLIANNYDFE